MGMVLVWVGLTSASTAPCLCRAVLLQIDHVQVRLSVLCFWFSFTYPCALPHPLLADTPTCPTRPHSLTHSHALTLLPLSYNSLTHTLSPHPQRVLGNLDENLNVVMTWLEDKQGDLDKVCRHPH